jgi:hypothetical protein
VTLAPGETVVFTARSPFTPASILAFEAGDIGQVVRCGVAHAVVLVAGVQAVAPFERLRRIPSVSGDLSDRRVPRRPGDRPRSRRPVRPADRDFGDTEE